MQRRQAGRVGAYWFFLRKPAHRFLCAVFIFILKNEYFRYRAWLLQPKMIACLQKRRLLLIDYCWSLLEHIILKRITTYLENETILSPHQHGFRKGLSTVTRLMELAHDISKSIDQQKQVDLIFLDFSKAFDKVSHKKLMSKLEFYLGAGPVITWIKNYLSNRSQFVEVNNEISASTHVWCTTGLRFSSCFVFIIH